MFKFTAHPTLQQQDHRPWPIPRGPWVMQQQWHDLLFAHWPVEASALRPHIPAPLDIDTFEGKAWLGIVPFYMAHVKPRGCPSVPGLSFFPELNVRTYVRYKDKPGVWFFSLEAGNPIAVEIARKGFHLPYFNARMHYEKRDDVYYFSERIHKNAPLAQFQARYAPISDVKLAQKDTLTHWLTERYALYSQSASGQLYRGDIHHPPWPLQEAEAEFYKNNMLGDLPEDLVNVNSPPLLHFSQSISVVVWPLVKLSNARYK